MGASNTNMGTIEEALLSEIVPSEVYGEKLSCICSNVEIVTENNEISTFGIQRGNEVKFESVQATIHGDRVPYNLAVICKGVWIADLLYGNTKEKILDWYKGGLPVRCAVTRTSGKYLYVEIGFYGKLSEANVLQFIASKKHLFFWDKKRNTVGEMVVTRTGISTFDFKYLGKMYLNVPYVSAKGKLFLSRRDVKKPRKAH